MRITSWNVDASIYVCYSSAYQAPSHTEDQCLLCVWVQQLRKRLVELYMMRALCFCMTGTVRPVYVKPLRYNGDARVCTRPSRGWANGSGCGEGDLLFFRLFHRLMSCTTPARRARVSNASA